MSDIVPGINQGLPPETGTPGPTPAHHADLSISADVAWLLATGAPRGRQPSIPGAALFPGNAGTITGALIAVTFPSPGGGGYILNLPWVGEPPLPGDVVLCAQYGHARVVLGTIGGDADPPPYDDTAVRALITADEARITALESAAAAAYFVGNSGSPFSIGSGGGNTEMDYTVEAQKFNVTHSTSTNPDLVFAALHGLYRVTLDVVWSDDTGGTRFALIGKGPGGGGVTVVDDYQPPSNGGQARNHITATVELNPAGGDYIYSQVWQNSGNLLTVLTNLAVVREAPM